MRWAQRLLSAGALSAVLLLTGMSGTAVANGLASEGFADLAARVTPAVVSISTHRSLDLSADNPGENADQEKNKNSRSSASLGSGFVIDPSGYVVTNYHVVAGADEILITLRGGKSFPGALIGADEKTDLALLKVDVSSPLPFVSLAIRTPSGSATR